MDSPSRTLHFEPFASTPDDTTFVETETHCAALAVLDEVYRNPHGIGLVMGELGTGRCTVVRHYLSKLPEETARALVDGTGLDRGEFLRGILRGFGYEVEGSTNSELSNILKVFVEHQASEHEPPMLVVANADAMHPKALEELCRISDIQTRRKKSAVRIVLVGRPAMKQVIGAPAMQRIAESVTGQFMVKPLTIADTKKYLLGRLSAAGAVNPETFFEPNEIRAIFEQSGGIPAAINDAATETLGRGELPRTSKAIAPADNAPRKKSPLAASFGTLLVSYSGKTVRTLDLRRKRILIGRAAHNDISIDSSFISRYHALVIAVENGAWLVDLNSTNGSLVNSVQVEYCALRNNDIISIGDHRFKYINEKAVGTRPASEEFIPDTTQIFKALPFDPTLTTVLPEDTLVEKKNINES